MRIRPAVPEEREALEALQRRASLALGEYRAELEAHPDAIDLPAGFIARGNVLVAEVDGELVGFAALDGPELDGLFVEPGHWRSGVGTALVEAAVHEVRCRGLSLVTVVANPTAREFYEKCGFAIEGEETTRFGPALRMSR
jgi:GNAT superfamily N-acetyltransferase